MSHTVLLSYDVCKGQLPIEGDVSQSVSLTHSDVFVSNIDTAVMQGERLRAMYRWKCVACKMMYPYVSHSIHSDVSQCLLDSDIAQSVSFTVMCLNVPFTVIYSNVSHSKLCIPTVPTKVIYPSVSHSQWCIPVCFIWSNVPQMCLSQSDVSQGFSITDILHVFYSKCYIAMFITQSDVLQSVK